MSDIATYNVTVSSQDETFGVDTDNDEQFPVTLDSAIEQIISESYIDITDKPSINGVTLVGNKTTEELGIQVGVTSWNGETGDVTYTPPVQSVNGRTGDVTGLAEASAIPTKTSQLTNNSGFITSADIPTIPTKTSQLTNDSGYITASAIPTVPTKTSQLTNDSGYITSASVPTKTSQLTNDSGFITSAPVSSVNGKTGAVVLSASDVSALPSSTTIPSKTSDLNNDSGYITGITSTDVTNALGYTPLASYTETDPTVPSWAKASSKPSYTASEVGAIPSTSLVTSISSSSTDSQVPSAKCVYDIIGNVETLLASI